MKSLRAFREFLKRIARESLLFRFSGRATRREYLFFLVFGTFAFFMGVAADYDVISWPVMLGSVGLVAAASVRRSHDSGRSGWTLLMIAIPYVGWFAYVMIMLESENDYTNEFGPDPRVKSYENGDETA